MWLRILMYRFGNPSSQRKIGVEPSLELETAHVVGISVRAYGFKVAAWL